MYKYVAVDHKGHREYGVVDLNDYTEALRYVRRNYGMVLQLEEVVQYKPCSQSYTDRQRTYFFRQLAAILQSGMTLSEGFNILATGKDSKILHVVKSMNVGINNGLSVHNAMAQIPEFFTELCLTLARVGETTGKLPAMCLQLADYYDKKVKFENYFEKVLAYPLLVLLVGIAVFFLFLFVVLPNVGSLYASLHAPTDGALGILLALQQFLVTWWFLFIAILLFGGYFLYHYRHYLVESLLNLPYIRDLYAETLELRFCKLLVLLLNSGVDILTAINSASLVITHELKYIQVQNLKTSLAKGEDLADILEREEGVFSPVVRGFMIVGFRTGALAALLQDAINFQEDAYNQRMDKLKEYLPSVILLFVAFFVGFMMIGIMHPIFNVFDALPVYG